MKEGLRIYNLLTRLAGNTQHWKEHVDRAKDMGFNAIYINPFHYPGFSGSLYAPKDYYRVNPIFLADPDSNGMDEIKKFVSYVHKKKMLLIMDLVINHTAIDCDLTLEHTDWYARNNDGSIKNPSAIDPANADNVTVWGDLAEIDNEHSPDRDNLWEYWEELVRTYLEMGFDGFRCDAAYQVCSGLWRYLFAKARSINPDTVFIAETLGCKEEDIVRLASDGFDYIYNSSKWWNFSDDWCLRQYNLSRNHAPSLSFPETHDTERLAAESDVSPAVSGQRYLFSAVFSKGLLLPLGYEYGFTKRFNVVHTSPNDWETASFDLGEFISRVNSMKAKYEIFNEENLLEVVDQPEQQVLVLKKTSLDGAQKALCIINKNWHLERCVKIDSLAAVLGTKAKVRDITPAVGQRGKNVPDRFECVVPPAGICVLLAQEK